MIAYVMIANSKTVNAQQQTALGVYAWIRSIERFFKK